MRRLLAFVVATAGVATLACYPIESPPGGVAAITPLVPPFSAVVVGDTMRDSSGAVQPLRVYAFDTHGDTLKAATPSFVVLDSGAHVAGSLLIGDSARGTPIRVVGSLGTLQTPPFSIFVSVRPTTLAAATPVDSQGHTDTLDAVPDSTWSRNAFSLQLKVLGGANDSTGAAGWIAWYHVDLAPASRDTAPGAYVVDGQMHPTTADTADVSGNLSRQVVLRAGALTDTALVLGHAVDSIVVTVRASYKGQPLANSPMRLVIPVKFKGFSTP